MKTAPETTEYVEEFPIELDQPTIAWLSWLERHTGEPARQIARRFLRQCRDEFGRAAGSRIN